MLWKLFYACLGLLITIYFLIATNYGLHIIFKGIACVIPGKLTITQLDGKLISPIYIKNLSYQSTEGSFTVNTLRFKWSAAQLLKHKVMIDQLVIDQLNIHLSESKNKNDKFDLQQLHWLQNLIIRYLSIQQIHIVQDQKVILNVHTLEIKEQSDNYYSLIARTTQGDIDGSYRFTWGSPIAWEIIWQLHIPSLQTIFPEAQGKISGKGRITSLKNNLDIFADLQVNKFNIPNLKIDSLTAKIDSRNAGQLTASTILIKNINYNDNNIPSIELNLSSQLLHHNLVSHVNLLLNKQNKINGDIQLDNIKDLNANTSIKGNLTLLLKNLNKFIVTPYIKNVQGNLRADMQLSGKINNPIYLIKAQLNQGQALVPKLNLSIKKLTASSSYHSSQPLIFSGTFNSGAGKGQFKGKLNLEEKMLPLELTLTGKHLQMVNLSEYKMTASPDVLIEINHQNTTIKGSLFDVSAQITPKDFSSVATLPTETIILDKTPTENNIPQNLYLQMQIVLGDNNFIAYDNLRAKLKGKLTISQKSGQLPTANGELYTVKGRYRAYGNLLKITQGKLIYTGNLLSNPGLSIKAIKQLETSSFAEDQSQFASEHNTNSLYQGVTHITVGIDVSGTLNKPQVGFYSDPAGMAQNDILSYLLFGYPQSEIKNMNGLEILNKVTAGLNNGESKTDKITKNIQHTLGLNNLGISSIETYDAEKNKSQSTSAVNIEKKLSKKFSIQYRIGLFNALSVLNVKYKINKLFALQSETSNQSNGVDLLFEYEHD